MKEDRKTIYDLDDIANRVAFAIDLVGTLHDAIDHNPGCAKYHANSLCAASTYLQLLGSELRSCVDDLFAAKETKSQEHGKNEAHKDRL